MAESSRRYKVIFTDGASVMVTTNSTLVLAGGEIRPRADTGIETVSFNKQHVRAVINLENLAEKGD